jgi:hypothetical protein
LALVPNLTEVKQLFAPVLLEQGHELGEKGKIDETIAKYQAAQQMDSHLNLSVYSWNMLCWLIPLPIHGHIIRFLNDFLKNQILSFFMSQNILHSKMINFTHFRYFRLITIILIRELAKVLLV